MSAEAVLMSYRKNICCGFSLELPLCCGYSLESFCEAILMSTHNIYFYGEITIIPKLSSNTHLICSIDYW